MLRARLWLSLFALFAVPFLRAQQSPDSGDSSDEKQQPDVEIPDFSNLDEYIYQPKSTLNFGMRFITGPQVIFNGKGSIPAPEDILSETQPDASRTYHDGTVNPDDRDLPVSSVGTVQVPPASDGKTNSWNYDDSSQLTSNDYMQFHTYSATSSLTDPLDDQGKAGLGLELSVAPDIVHFGKRLTLGIFGGVSLNDVSAATYRTEGATMTTTTDTYDLYGQVPPPAPYTSPTTTTENIISPTGVGETASVTNQTLISDAPIAHAVTESNYIVTDHWDLAGATYTLRTGPQLSYKITDHLKLVVSVGGLLDYAGTQYQITEVLNPPTGAPIIDEISNGVSAFRFGQYADLTLVYDITDTSGLYLGGYYQGARSYEQWTQDTRGNNWSATVDLNDQQGVRTGMDFRF